MGVAKGRFVGFEPLEAFGQNVPPFRAHAFGREVTFLKIRAAGDAGPNLVGEGAGLGLSIADGHAEEVCDDHAMEHDGVKRIERARLGEAVMDDAVAVGDPTFTVGAHAGHGPITAATPDAVGPQGPEG